MTNSLRVMVVDDNPVVRSGLVALLTTDDNVLIAGEAGDGKTAVDLARRVRPDVVLLDVRMPLVDGVTAAGPLSEMAAVLILTYTEDAEVVRAAIRNGASGYLVHGSFTAEELLTAVYDVASERTHPFSPVAVEAMMDAVRRNAPGSGNRARFKLSVRETEVMELIARGHANDEIAARLVLTEKTVKNYINRIYAKLSVEHRAAAVAQWLGTAENPRV